MRICEVTGKSVLSGNQVSHSHRLNKRIWRPNIQVMKLPLNGENFKVRVSTKAMKLLKGKSESQVKKILMDNKTTLSSRLSKKLFSN